MTPTSPRKEKEVIKRISFNEWDAYLIYEWWLALNQGAERAGRPIMCACCPPIANRLEKFIGSKEAKVCRKNVKDNPYFFKKK